MCDLINIRHVCGVLSVCFFFFDWKKKHSFHNDDDDDEGLVNSLMHACVQGKA